MRKLYFSLLLLFTLHSSRGQTTIFFENVGTPVANTVISLYNGWQNGSPVSFTSGSPEVDVRTSTSSTGYTGASGNGNVFFTNTVGRFLLVSGINTTGYTAISLSLGHFKSTTAGNNELTIEVSSDGTTYSPLTYSRPTGSGTANWALITPNGSIPATANLRIRFTQTSITTQFRIDDILLSGTSGTCSGIPTSQAGFGTITPSSVAASVSITAGTGGVGRVVKMNTTNNFTNMVDGDNPAANTVYGGGQQVIYNGTGVGPVNVSGLTASTTYWMAVYEYNCASGRFYLNPGTVTSFLTTVATEIVLPGEILINQMSPDYGAASDEYVELVNLTNKTFDLSTLAIRYQSAAGGNGPAGGVLSGIMTARRYWVLSPNAVVTVGLTVALPRDGAIVAGFAAAAGQIGLVRISDNVVIDAVGYGNVTGGDYFETTPAVAPPTDGGIRRNPNAVDTDDNSVDFVTVANAAIRLNNSSNIPLPVRFGNIKATPQGSGVKVDWSNFTETDVVNYKIERSVNGQPFVTLGTVGARLNNGSRADYSYFDASPVNGINLYRIQSLEMGGKQLYSIIVRVDTRLSDKSTVTIYPNPASAAEVSFQATDLPKGNYSIQVYNAAAQQVHSRRLVHAGGFVTESLELPASTKSGIYHLQIISSDMRLSKSFIIR